MNLRKYKHLLEEMMYLTYDEETDGKDDDENDEVDSEDETGDESGELVDYISVWYSTVYSIRRCGLTKCHGKAIYIKFITIQRMLKVFFRTRYIVPLYEKRW